MAAGVPDVLRDTEWTVALIDTRAPKAGEARTEWAVEAQARVESKRRH